MQSLPGPTSRASVSCATVFGSAIRACANCPWECPVITRLRPRKALRWCASGRLCSGRVRRELRVEGWRARGVEIPRKEKDMAGVWRKVGQYLGLVEDDELDELEEPLP